MGPIENEVYHSAIWWNPIQTFLKLKSYLEEGIILYDEHGRSKLEIKMSIYYMKSPLAIGRQQEIHAFEYLLSDSGI